MSEQLISDIVNIWIDWINLAPLTARREYHERLVSHFAAQIHEESNIFVDRYRNLAIQFEPPRADISQVTDNFQRIVVN